MHCFKNIMIYIFALNYKSKQDVDCVFQIKIKNDEERISIMFKTYV